MKLKHANGRVVDVPDNIAETYLSFGWDTADGEPDGKPSKAWKVDALKEYAVQHEIPLGEATKKDEILAVIAAAGKDPAADGEPDAE